MSEQRREAATPRICPTCGTRLGENVTRCVVCGTDLRGGLVKADVGRRSQVSLSLPVALALLAVFAMLSAGLTFAATRFTGLGTRATPTGTATPTSTSTNTPEPTFTETPESSPTPLPPIDYKVVPQDTCAGLAYRFHVSVRSILDLNNLTPDCFLTVGATLKIPQPTPTPSPEPTGTLAAADSTAAACDKISYTVQANDTLGGISKNYNVEMQAIINYNNMAGDTVFTGQVLIIPLCKRLPTPGPSPTPTLPPPYPAPNLLLPRDGEYLSLASDSVTLQWASIGPLLDNESYRVTVVDLTEGTGTVRLVMNATDTKAIIPSTFRPADSNPHVMSWSVTTVRVTGKDANGNPIYASAGAESAPRVFTWSGAAAVATPTP